MAADEHAAVSGDAGHRIYTRTRFIRVPPPDGAEITPADPDPEVLAHASRRLRSRNPVTVRAAVRNAAAVAPHGVLSRASVLGEPRLHHRVGRAALRDLNREGVLDNLGDNEAGLRDILGEAFHEVALELVGAMAVFHARGPRHPGR